MSDHIIWEGRETSSAKKWVDPACTEPGFITREGERRGCQNNAALGV